MKHHLIAAVLLMRCIPAHAELAPTIEADVVREVWKLADMLRRDVEAVTVELDGVKAVELLDTTPTGTVYESTGALVPFILEGVGNGNVTQEYVALFRTHPVDDDVTWESRQAQLLHQKQTQLLAFAQIDRRLWGMLDWESSIVSGSDVQVVAHAYGCVKYRCCYNERGSVTLQVNGNLFGPNLIVTNHPNPLFSRNQCVAPTKETSPSLLDTPK